MKLWSIHNVPVQKFTCSNCFYISGEASTCDTSVTDRSLCPLDVNCEFHSIWVEMAVGLTSQLFLRLPASHIFCQRNKFRVHIAHWFFGTQSFFCYCFMNLSFSLSLVLCRAIRWGVLFPCHPLRFLQLLMYAFFLFNC